MKLRVTFELPLPIEAKQYLNIIANINGYDEANSSISAEEFICEVVCKKQVSALFQSLILNPLDAYLGLAGRDQVDTICKHYIENHVVTADMVSD